MQCGATDVASFLPSIACSLSRSSSVGEHLSRSQEVKRTWVSLVRVPPRAAHGLVPVPPRAAHGLVPVPPRAALFSNRKSFVCMRLVLCLSWVYIP